jgi:ComF family protein
MVHALKYESCHAMSDVLARPMADAIAAAGWAERILIPVPLHPTRLRERGYNQAQWLADSVAALTGLECLPYGLLRTRSTAHQVGASAAERHANMEGAFVPASDALVGRAVILVDDVFTTGATLCAGAQAALAGGATSVVSLTATAARAGVQTAPPQWSASYGDDDSQPEPSHH